MSTAAAIVLFMGVTAYAVFGGADFGAGFWDLTAGGTERGGRPREVIDHSIGPVWEANHVWLIFCFVVLWTCFPEAYASITLTLFVPLTIAAFGIVLRGASFAFRKAVLRTRDRRSFGAVFAVSSVLVPYCMGAVAGAIASGRVPAGGEAGDPWTSWVNPTSILGGVLAVCVVAYLAAVYLVWDARRLSDDGMVEYFRRRAFAAGLVAGVVALVGIFVLERRRRVPLRRPHVSCPAPGAAVRGGRRRLAAAAPPGEPPRRTARRDRRRRGPSWWRWGVAQWDYMLPESLTVEEAAAPTGTITAVLVATGLAVAVHLPGVRTALHPRPARAAARGVGLGDLTPRAVTGRAAWRGSLQRGTARADHSTSWGTSWYQPLKMPPSPRLRAAWRSTHSVSPHGGSTSSRVRQRGRHRFGRGRVWFMSDAPLRKTIAGTSSAAASSAVKPGTTSSSVGQ